MRKIIATLPKENTQNAENFSGEKELVSSYKVVSVSSTGAPIALVDCRVWMGRSRTASKVYASVWVMGRESQRYFSGYGTASGYGYCKESSAIDCAIDSAGISLSTGIQGRGVSVAQDALIAIAVALGYPEDKCIIV